MVCVGLCEQRPFAPLLSFCCAAPVIGGLTLGTLGMIRRYRCDHLYGKIGRGTCGRLVLGKNCNLTEGLLRKARKFCEERNSVEAIRTSRDSFPLSAAARRHYDADLRCRRFAVTHTPHRHTFRSRKICRAEDSRSAGNLTRAAVYAVTAFEIFVTLHFEEA
jgi:hypothetical protein